MDLKNLRPNIKNPRKIKPSHMAALKKSLEKFGELSCFVYNIQTKNMVSGHQRQKAFESGKITITERYKEPSRCRTIAEGYVDIGGERFKYREVDASPEWEAEAMLAANAHGGEWDNGLLNILKADFPSMNLELAGLEIPAFVPVSIPTVDVGVVAPETPSAPPSRSSEDEDRKHIADEKKIEEQIPTLPRSDGSAFSQVEEVKEAPGRRIVIIIDCPTEDVKQELRSVMREEVEKRGAKFF